MTSRTVDPLPQEPQREKLHVEGMANLTSLVVYLRSQKVPEHWIKALFAYGDEIETLRKERDQQERFKWKANAGIERLRKVEAAAQAVFHPSNRNDDLTVKSDGLSELWKVLYPGMGSDDAGNPIHLEPHMEVGEVIEEVFDPSGELPSTSIRYKSEREIAEEQVRRDGNPETHEGSKE